jgi:hypothetical protein
VIWTMKDVYTLVNDCFSNSVKTITK